MSGTDKETRPGTNKKVVQRDIGLGHIFHFLLHGIGVTPYTHQPHM